MSERTTGDELATALGAFLPGHAIRGLDEDHLSEATAAALRRVLAVYVEAQHVVRHADLWSDEGQERQTIEVTGWALHRMAEAVSMSTDAHDDRRLAALLEGGAT